MYRQILGYFPSVVIPALVSMVMIFAYTRLLSPAAFGAYTYVFSAALVVQTSLFYALPIALTRFYPRAETAGREAALLKEAYVLFYGLSAAVIVVFLGLALVVDLPDGFRIAAWLALPMMLLRAAVLLNQSVNRSANRMSRVNAIDCLHAVLGFGFGLAGVYLLGRGPETIIFGLLAAAAICACIDLPRLASPLRRAAGALNRRELMKLVDYAWPLVAAYATDIILQNSDRFLLGSLGGAEALGIYAVAYSLVERPTTILCVSITTATFSLILQVLEKQGREAARIQFGRNGIALLVVTLPACAGLALTADYVAATLVGPAFRQGVAALLPVISLAALARGFRGHFIDHAFHLSGRPLTMLWSYVPATILNIGLNLWAVPRYGMTGAAWTAVVCQAVTVAGGWALAERQFPVRVPMGQLVRCVLAVVPMSAALIMIRFPLNWFGLMAAVLMGAAIYGAAAFALDVGECRSLGWEMLRERLRGRVAVPTS